MITHKFFILLGLSLGGMLVAQEQIVADTDDQKTSLEQVFMQQPKLLEFYKTLAADEQGEFAEMVEEIKDAFTQAIRDFNTIAENHNELVEKLKYFFGEENFSITIGFSNNSELTDAQQ